MVIYDHINEVHQRDPSIFTYLDGVMIRATSLEENIKKLCDAFHVLQDAGLKLRFEKVASQIQFHLHTPRLGLYGCQRVQ